MPGASAVGEKVLLVGHREPVLDGHVVPLLEELVVEACALGADKLRQLSYHAVAVGEGVAELVDVLGVGLAVPSGGQAVAAPVGLEVAVAVVEEAEPRLERALKTLLRVTCISFATKSMPPLCIAILLELVILRKLMALS